MRIKSTRLVIFENSTANFRLSVDTMLQKPRPDGSESSLVFIGKGGQGTFRPSVFLVFTYLTDDYKSTQGVYTSFAHMYKIRSMFEQMHQYLNQPDAFVDVNGEMTTSPKYSQPLILDNIGKNNDWVSLMLTRYKDPNSTKFLPAVAIQISKSGGYSSLLSGTEFEAVYDAIVHLDLVNLENQAVLLDLISKTVPEEDDHQGQSNYTPSPVSNAAYVKTATPRGNYGTPYQGQSYTHPAPTTAQTISHPQASYQTPVPQRTVSQPVPPIVPTPTPVVPTNPIAPAAQVQPTPTPISSPSKPKVSLDAVSQVKVDDIDLSIDDDNLINNIFSGDSGIKPTGND